MKISRIEIIDDLKGRIYTRWDCKVELSLQDEGSGKSVLGGQVAKFLDLQDEGSTVTNTKQRGNNDH